MRPTAAAIAALFAITAAPAPERPLPRQGRLGAAVVWKSGGAVVTSVEAGSPGEAGGLLVDDRVLAIGGRRLETDIDLSTALAAVRDKPVVLEIRRGDRTLATTVVPRAAPLESYPGLDVVYGAVSTRAGRLRTITTRPKGAAGRLPAILLVGWLSCDSIEIPPDSTDGFALVLRGIAERSGFVFARVDKPGAGDSEGVCAQTDLESELEGYRAGLAAVRERPDVDPSRVFLIGMSNGGGVTPLVAGETPVAGYVVSGGWLRTWYEHVLYIERRRRELAGQKPGEVSDAMKKVESFYDSYLNGRRRPSEVLRDRPDLASAWEDLPGHQYGRPASFFQQLQALNLAAAWERVAAPVLAIHGQFDWIMSPEDPQRIAEIVNARRPGSARYVEVRGMDHFYRTYDTPAEAFRHAQPGPFAQTAVDTIVSWLKEQAAKAAAGASPRP